MSESVIEREIERMVEPVAERVVQRLLAESKHTAPDALDAETQRLVNLHTVISKKTYLTRKEAALYLSVSERSISEWSARAVDQNPFPEENAGAEPRYKRNRIDEWTEREAQRQRLKLAS